MKKRLMGADTPHWTSLFWNRNRWGY